MIQRFKSIRYLLLPMLLLLSMTVPAQMTAEEKINQAPFHHHIHNFYFNYWDQAKPNYMAMHQHARAMSYDGFTHYLAEKLPSAYDKHNRIMLHNAYYIPLVVDLAKQQVKYTASYQTDHHISAVNADRVVWKNYPMNAKDIDLVKLYGCAKSNAYRTFSQRSKQENIANSFRVDPVYKRIIVNWQSRFVVDSLVQKTISTLQTGLYDHLFIDDIPRDAKACMNRNAGGKGSYDSWKAGQLDFLQRVTLAAHNMKGYHGKQIKVFGNIWSPYADTASAKWYADNILRLDHYYFESGGYAKEDVLNKQAANTLDPDTNQPAYKPLWGAGYIPAAKLSVSTNLKTMYQIANKTNNKGLYQNYLQQHYVAAGTAAAQGSWFGWYGETSVDKRDQSGRLIHSNEMQLLRALPDWENMAHIPLNEREYAADQNEYSSANSRFNADYVLSHNPINAEHYLVVKSLGALVNFGGGSIDQAYVVDDYFNKTSQSVGACFQPSKNNQYMFTCQHFLNKGMRIKMH